MTKADIVNAWFRERLSSGPIARNTEAYNQLVGALPDLISRLEAADAPKAGKSAARAQAGNDPAPAAAPDAPAAPTA